MPSLGKSVSNLLEADAFADDHDHWSQLIKHCARVGIDIRKHSDHLLSVATRSDDLHSEIKSLRKAVRVKAALIVLICFGCRIGLESLGSLPQESSLLDAFVMFCALLLGALMFIAFERGLPEVWSINVRSQPSKMFYKWVRLVLLDESTDQSGAIPKSWISLINSIDNLRKNELRDGTCRQAQKISAALHWSQSSLTQSKNSLRSVATLVPVTELTLAALLSVGFCGIPLVDILDGDDIVNLDHIHS